MNANTYYIVVILVGLINDCYLFPIGPSFDLNAPKNPFIRSHIPFQSTQKDVPLLQPSFQQNTFEENRRLQDPIFSDNAADWPTPPPIGGSPAQQSSSFNTNLNQNLQVQSNPSMISNQNQQTFNWVTPPPIPVPQDNSIRRSSFPTSPAEAHRWAQTNNQGVINGVNPFDNLPIQSTVRPQFLIPANSINPFDSLPTRSRQKRRQKRQNWPQTPADAHIVAQQQSNLQSPNANGMPNVPPSNPALPSNPASSPQQNPNGLPPALLSNPAVPKPAQNHLMPPLHNPIAPDPAVSGFPNTNGAVVLGKDPRNLPDVREQKIFLPSQLANQQDLTLSQNTPIKGGKPLLPSQVASMQQFGSGSNVVSNNVPTGNPSVRTNDAPVPLNPNPSIPSQPSPLNPAQPIPSQPLSLNPSPPIPSQQNPFGLSPALLNNPALPKPIQNPLMPPIHNPTLSDPSVSGFPNTNGAVVLGKEPRTLPDIREQKTFLPNQLANQQDLTLSQNTPLKESKILLPSQISAMQKFGTG